MKIYLGTDHAGFKLKEEIKQFLSIDYEVEDCGADVFDEQDDYPDFIVKAAKGVSENPGCMGIIFGGSGQGEAIVANKHKGIRAVVYNTENLDLIMLAREHNNANMLSIGARFVSGEHAKQAVKLFLDTPFSGDERHKRRIEKISQIES